MIPTGIKKLYQYFDSPSQINSTNLDTGFEINHSISRFQIEVADPSKNINFTVWQDSEKGKFGFVQIYTPPHRKTIAIEPMTCMANALQTGIEGGILFLEPGESREAYWGISFMS
jgi:aldose 1-epimerase